MTRGRGTGPAPSAGPVPPAAPRILHVVEAFSTGVFEIVRQLANAQAAAGHEVHIARGQRALPPAGFAERFDPRVTFHRLAWDVERRPLLLARAGAQLFVLLRRLQPDVVHLHSTFAGVTGAAVRRSGAATIYTPHGYSFLISSLPRSAAVAARGIERIVARRVTAVIAVSDAEAAQARGLGAPRVGVVHNGIAELDAAAPEPDPAPRSGVVGAGRMMTQRQPQQVAEIFARLPPGTPTAWIGDDADPAAAARMRALGTEITGWVSRETVIERTRAARIYVHWTAWDGHPLSVLEAIGAGTVVVAHDIAPVREILGADSVCASVEQAAETITALLADPARYERLRTQQRAAAEPFSARRMTERWAEVYARLMERRPINDTNSSGQARSTVTTATNTTTPADAANQ